jgi:hypothetical protein
MNGAAMGVGPERAFEPFALRAVVHLVRPEGRTARDLDALRGGIAAADSGTLFFHTVQGLLRHPEAEDPPADDLSSWVNGVLQDRETAERMAFAIQAHPTAPEPLRAALLQVLDPIPERVRVTRDAPAGGEFVFLTADSVAVPTGAVASTPADLYDLMVDADPSVWFYHVVEEGWFEPGGDTLLRWLRERGEERLALVVEEAAAEALPLAALRRRVLGRWRRSDLGRRIAHAAGRPEEERREAAHEAVAGLVRRMRRGTREP